MSRGSRIHSQIEGYYHDENDIPQEWKNVLPEKDEVMFVEKEEMLSGPIPVPLIGIPDLVTKDYSIYDIKSGKPRAYYAYQLAFYKYIIEKLYEKKVPHLYISYTDRNEKVELKFSITDKDLLRAWSNIEKGEPTKCEKCSGCPIKKTCSIWNSDEDPQVVLDLIAQQKLIESTQDDISSYSDVMIKVDAMKGALKEQVLRLEDLKKVARKELEHKSYMKGLVKITEKTVKRLPEGFKPKDYSEEPDIYK